jgi:NAD(P)-dependent dehydrogenase (short-subunit alcohol dehydrogenase family)
LRNAPNPIKTALITGSSSGFGLLTAVSLAQRGWRVIATMRDLSRREKLESAARAAGVLDRIEILPLDVTDNAQIAVLAARFAARELHAIVNNAGFAMAGFADDVSDAELRKQFDTNFFAHAAVTRAFLPQLRRQGFGHIVMVSSISGRSGFPGVSSYVASKFALEGWTESLRLELRPLGIQVALVEPGSFETGIWTTGTALAADASQPGSVNASRAKMLFERVKGAKRPDPQVVADCIARIVETPKPKLRYIVGRDAKIVALLRALLPWRAFEAILIKSSGIGS